MGYNIANQTANLSSVDANAKKASFAAYAAVDTKQYGPTFIDSHPDSIDVHSLSTRLIANQLGSPLRFCDINCDGYMDVCARWSDGPHCAIKQAGSSAFLSPMAAPYRAVENFADRNGWSELQYSSTLQMADIDGDRRADLCGRAAAGILCARSTGTGFTAAAYGSTFFTDAQGWDAHPAYYGSIRFADINKDGRADVCGRDGAGIYCARSTGGSFEWVTLWLADFTDAQGWRATPYGTTIQLGDINGDGRADVCGRGSAGIYCALAQAAGGFDSAALWLAAFTDAQGWGTDSAHYGSIRLVDVNGDNKADICGRGPTGFQCARSTGSRFDSPTQNTSDFKHALAWVDPQSGPPAPHSDVYFDGLLGSCETSPYGLVCAGP